MKKSIAMWLVVGGLMFTGLTLAVGQERPTGKPAEISRVWIFLSATGPDLSRDLSELRGMLKRTPKTIIRAALVSDDPKAATATTEPWPTNLRALMEFPTIAASGIPVMDVEAITLARDLGITRLPAFALEELAPPTGGRRIHVVQGRGARFEEVLK